MIHVFGGLNLGAPARSTAALSRRESWVGIFLVLWWDGLMLSFEFDLIFQTSSFLIDIHRSIVKCYLSFSNSSSGKILSTNMGFIIYKWSQSRIVFEQDRAFIILTPMSIPSTQPPGQPFAPGQPSHTALVSWVGFEQPAFPLCFFYWPKVFHQQPPHQICHRRIETEVCRRPYAPPAPAKPYAPPGPSAPPPLPTQPPRVVPPLHAVSSHLFVVCEWYRCTLALGGVSVSPPLSLPRRGRVEISLIFEYIPPVPGEVACKWGIHQSCSPESPPPCPLNVPKCVP